MTPGNQRDCFKDRCHVTVDRNADFRDAQCSDTVRNLWGNMIAVSVQSYVKTSLCGSNNVHRVRSNKEISAAKQNRKRACCK